MKKETKKEVTKKIKKVVMPETKCESKDECCCKEKTAKRISFSTIVLFLILAAGIGAYIKFANVAIVNGKSISRVEYIKQLQKQDNKSVLNQMVQESLINSAAAKNNVKVEQKEIDSEITTIEAQVKAQGQTLETAMAAEGLTKPELVKQLRLRKLIEKMSNPNTDITQLQIDDFLTKNKGMLPKDMAKDKLEALAKEELISQAKSDAASSWLKKITSEAKIIFK